jgi:hypothetical protein
MLRQAVPTSNNHVKQGTCTRLLLLGERKSSKHEPRSKISTKHRRPHWPDHCISTLLRYTAAAAAATPSSSSSTSSSDVKAEGPSGGLPRRSQPALAPFPGLLNCSQTTAADCCCCCVAPDHTLEPIASSEQRNVRQNNSTIRWTLHLLIARPARQHQQTR